MPKKHKIGTKLHIELKSGSKIAKFIEELHMKTNENCTQLVTHILAPIAHAYKKRQYNDIQDFYMDLYKFIGEENDK